MYTSLSRYRNPRYSYPTIAFPGGINISLLLSYSTIYTVIFSSSPTVPGGSMVGHSSQLWGQLSGKGESGLVLIDQPHGNRELLHRESTVLQKYYLSMLFSVPTPSSSAKYRFNTTSPKHVSCFQAGNFRLQMIPNTLKCLSM